MKRAIKILVSAIGALILLVCLLFGHRDRTLDELIPKYASPPSQFIEISGLNVHYRDEGNSKDSLPIVLLHGTGSSLHTYDIWSKILKENKRVIRLDLPGFGLTGPFPDHNYEIDHYVHFLAEFFQTKNIRKCILAGNSLGGQIAWQFTLEYPKKVHKLILIDSAGYPKNSESEPLAFRIAKIPVLNKILTYITPRIVVKQSVQNVYSNKKKVSDKLVDRYFDLSLRSGNRQAFIDRMQVSYDTSGVKQIMSLNQPTLILWGEDDQLITLASAYRFHKDLPNDTLVILKNSGHIPMEENPERSLSSVMNFIEIEK